MIARNARTAADFAQADAAEQDDESSAGQACQGKVLDLWAVAATASCGAKSAMGR